MSSQSLQRLQNQLRAPLDTRTKSRKDAIIDRLDEVAPLQWSCSVRASGNSSVSIVICQIAVLADGEWIEREGSHPSSAEEAFLAAADLFGIGKGGSPAVQDKETAAPDASLLDTTWTLGKKYSGKKVRDIPLDYWEWALNPKKAEGKGMDILNPDSPKFDRVKYDAAKAAYDFQRANEKPSRSRPRLVG